MIGEPHYYKGKKHYDPVIPWKHSWATKWKRSFCGHKNCKIEEHRVSSSAYWIDLYWTKDKKEFSKDKDFEQYIIMQEI